MRVLLPLVLTGLLLFTGCGVDGQDERTSRTVPAPSGASAEAWDNPAYSRNEPPVAREEDRTVLRLYSWKNDSLAEDEQTILSGPIDDMRLSTEGNLAVILVENLERGGVYSAYKLDLLDLRSQERTVLVEDAQHWSYIGWLPDNRLLLTGGQVLLADQDGGELEPISSMPPGSIVARPSPSGKQLAYLTFRDGVGFDLVVRSLETGEFRTYEGPFRPAGQDGPIEFAWSPDEKEIVIEDYEEPHPGKGRLLKLDLLSGEVSQVIPSAVQPVWTETGLVYAETTPSGDTLDRRLVFLPADEEQERHFPISGNSKPVAMVSDSRILIWRWADAAAHYTILDLASGDTVDLGSPGSFVGILADGRFGFVKKLLLP